MKNKKNPIISVCTGRPELSNLPCSQLFRLAIFPQTTVRFSGSNLPNHRSDGNEVQK
jgi:hypothetical protein